MVNNFETTGQIQLILVPLDQKLGEITNRTIIFFLKSKREKFLRLFLANSLSRERRRFTFSKFFWKALTPLQRVATVE